MIRRAFLGLALTAALLLGQPLAGQAADAFITLQSTTSTQNSGLFDHILPRFTEKTGIEVRVVAVGTGQALKNARNGDGDVLLVHAKPAEEKFIAEGFGVERFDVMYNDFVIVGPAADRAGLAGLRDAPEAVVDSSWYEALAPSPIEVGSVAINDLFSAGDRVAFHVSQRGRYLGGLPGVDDARRGRTARLDCAGLARVADGRVESARVISDRMGTARVLLQEPGR